MVNSTHHIPPAAAPAALREQDWQVLLRNIQHGRCTPFLGSGVCHGVVPLAADIAQKWAKQYGYPLKDRRDLARVAQFVATEYAPIYPKQAIADFIAKLPPPDFYQPDEPHATLADLPLPVYITTNYDNFMFRALHSRQRSPRLEMCRWNSLLRDEVTSYLAEGFEPTPDEPVVFHLHGWSGMPESIVLSEDDYLDFLVNLKDKIIPHRIERSMAGSSLLFLGYQLADWDFRVLFRSLVSLLQVSIAYSHVSVQLEPAADKNKAQQVRRYLDRYFGNMKIQVYWGTCRSFVSQLRERWQAFNGA